MDDLQPQQYIAGDFALQGPGLSGLPHSEELTDPILAQVSTPSLHGSMPLYTFRICSELLIDLQAYIPRSALYCSDSVLIPNHAFVRDMDTCSPVCTA